ncbi:MAG: hypothetical protein ACLQIB_12100 [Isosphaeraceae bacterium]
MFANKEHRAMGNCGSDSRSSKGRRCLPVVGTLEDRSLLSVAGAAIAPAAASLHGPILNHTPIAAEVHRLAKPVAQGERAGIVGARPLGTIRYPGGSVTINRHGVHVKYPGGSVHVNRHGTIVTFPGGSVVAGFGGVVVRFPGGSVIV